MANLGGIFRAVEILRARAQRKRDAGHAELARELEAAAREVKNMGERGTTDPLDAVRCPTCGALVPVRRTQ